MSQTPSNHRGSASASSESQKEGAVPPPQLLENLQGPEQQRTCGDQQGLTANTRVPNSHLNLSCNSGICTPCVPDDFWKACTAGNHALDLLESEKTGPSCSGNEVQLSCSDSPEFTEVLALSGRAITVVNASTQTDWEWAELKFSDSCQVQKEIEDFEARQTEVLGLVAVPESSEDENTEDEKTPEKEHGICCVGPRPLLAFKPESTQAPLLVEKVPEIESKWDAPAFIPCDYCQQPSGPFISCELLESETNPELLFCCEQARKMREFLLAEEQAFREKELNRRIDVNPHPPFMSKEKKEVTREQVQQRLEWEKWEPQRVKKEDEFQINTVSFSLSNGIYVIKAEPQFTQMDIKDTTGMFMLQEETDGQQKGDLVIMKSYPSGKPFVTLFPDKTGNVFYPSGNVAIVMSSVGAGDFTYLILEDKDTEAKVEAIFTNKGQSTCYHPNGLIWVNMTPVGGFLYSETGALRRRWDWPHIHVLPFQPLTLALGPHISIRIQTQNRMYLTFAHRQHSMRFNVGSKLKLICPGSYEKLGPDVLRRHLHMKSLEIYSLLDRMQTCVAYRSANPHNIKPQYSLTAQMERLRRQMEKERTPKKDPESTNDF